MNKYDKIYYELDPFFPSLCLRLTTGEKIAVHSGPVVVLTIEEAIEMWSAAERRDRWYFEMEEFKKQGLPEPPDFATYLQSKGINI